MVVNWPEELRLIINTVEIVGPDPEQVYARLHELISEVIDQERESAREQSWSCCHFTDVRSDRTLIRPWMD